MFLLVFKAIEYNMIQQKTIVLIIITVENLPKIADL